MPSRLLNAAEETPALPDPGSLFLDHLRGHASPFDWRRRMASGLYYSGALRLAAEFFKTQGLELSRTRKAIQLRRVHGPKFLILCYHRVGLGGVPLYTQLSPELFEAQMRHLRKNYRIVSLEVGLRTLRDPQDSEPCVAITFDDGYRDVYTHAFPILRRYSIPATVYLIWDSMETGEVSWYDRIFLALQVVPESQFEIDLDCRHCFELFTPERRFYSALEIVRHLRAASNDRRKEICSEIERRIPLPQKHLQEKILTWEQVHAMQSAGVSIGSHTVSHPVVSRLSETEMKNELEDSKKRLEKKLTCPVLDFAFPFGHSEDCGSAALGLLDDLGYRSGVTTVSGANTRRSNPFSLHRVQVDEQHTLAQFALLLNQHLFSSQFGQHEEAPLKGRSLQNASRPTPAHETSEARDA